MRSTWNGYLKLGTLSVPVKLYSAVKSAGPHFVQLHAADHAPLTRRLVCTQDGQEVSYKDIVRAVEHENGYVEVSDDDLQAGTGIERNLVIRQFSEPHDIDPIYYDKPYYVVPDKGGEFAYTLLRQAFVKAKKIAVATYLFYEKQHLGIISASGGLLRLQQLRYADEIVPATDLPARSLQQPAPAQVDTAVRLMNRYSTDFYVSDYRNEQTDALKELVGRRAKGLAAPKRERPKPVEATAEGDVVKVMRDILGDRNRQSLKAGTE